MASYLDEPVDRLPFSTPAKQRRYATGRYRGAAGLNWYGCDPTLRFLMRQYLGSEGLAWAEPHLHRAGALMGGPVARWAEETDADPPRLEKYDRWGHDISEIRVPHSFDAARGALVERSFTSPEFAAEARRAGIADPAPLAAAWNYLLYQADIGMGCALGTGGDMVVELAREFAPVDVRKRVAELFAAGMFSGEAAQMLTERTGGSDLGALESTATADGDAWRLNGFKWFASNAGASAFVVLAKPITAPDSVRGIAPFLVLRERRDGGRNGFRIRRLKDKLGTKSVPSAEMEFTDAEAFLLAPPLTPDGGPADGHGMARMMELTNGARLAIAMMGLGCARRALAESLCYASAREAFGTTLAEQPLMRRKLAGMIVDVEAAQALVFDGYLGPRLRLAPALAKLRAARLGVTAASDAIEVHGGNGYIEQWPVARILRDAQVNPIWEGGDNILCLDVRRAIVREEAHLPFLDRLRHAAEQAPEHDATAELVTARIGHLQEAITAWQKLDPAAAEARLFPLAQFMADVHSAAVLLEQAGWEQRELGTGRKALVASLYAAAHLAEPGPLRGIGEPDEGAERFAELSAGALDETARIETAPIETAPIETAPIEDGR